MDIYLPPNPSRLAKLVAKAGGSHHVAKTIKVNDRTVRKWLSGERRPQKHNVDALRAMTKKPKVIQQPQGQTVAMTQESAR